MAPQVSQYHDSLWEHWKKIILGIVILAVLCIIISFSTGVWEVWYGMLVIPLLYIGGGLLVVPYRIYKHRSNVTAFDNPTMPKSIIVKKSRFPVESAEKEYSPRPHPQDEYLKPTSGWIGEYDEILHENKRAVFI